MTETDTTPRVLFLCTQNAAHSQMAEAFARAYGTDVIVPASAGLSPAMGIAGDTMRAMAEKGLDLRDHFPKAIRHLGRARPRLVVDEAAPRVVGPPQPPARGQPQLDVRAEHLAEELIELVAVPPPVHVGLAEPERAVGDDSFV